MKTTLSRSVAILALAGCVGPNEDHRTQLDPVPTDAAVTPPGDAADPTDAVPAPTDAAPVPADAASPPRPDALEATADADRPPPPADAAPAAPGPDWSLPLCDRACDRVVDCAVDACAGFDWSTAGGLSVACAARCDDAQAARLLAADDCDATLDLVAARVPDFESTCASNPCVTACNRAAHCIVEVCPAIGDDAEVPIATDCVANCDGQDIAWIESFDTCEALVGVLTDNDPGFREACEGRPPEPCPVEAECVAFAHHVTECIVEHCDGHADAFTAGIDAAVLAYCLAPECPSAADVRALGNPDLACDAPGLDGIGTGEPFARLCAGTLGVDAADIRTACDRIRACPGGDAAGTVDTCMVGFAFAADTADRIACVEAGADCAAIFGCLQ